MAMTYPVATCPACRELGELVNEPVPDPNAFVTWLTHLVSSHADLSVQAMFVVIIEAAGLDFVVPVE